ncbi:hypothetical protein PCASD_06426 [Puccinia coronata f. sp. avenae]|nr:hypothetical protein PCASD_09224 [Puccinia coronata f. sp. avenae]PLW36527.1 hypothetical protein PCASD_06428 [Puccinia coronata f. sp. avenae]PLW36547.1 hypothetical protein PCASD_06426 [Puccinia coronata f. sp. avenae]
MMFSGAPGSQPRPYMIARTGLTEGLSPIQNSENLAKYVIDLDHKEYRDPDTYEVLCGQRDAVHWVRFSSINGTSREEDIHARAWRPVELGRDSDGRLWFIGLAPEPQVLIPGNSLPCKVEDGTNFARFFDESKSLIPRTSKRLSPVLSGSLCTGR